MLAIAFAMVVADLRRHHPLGISSAYSEIGKTVATNGFERIQGRVYLTTNPDMANLMAAILALKTLPWFAKCVRDIRGFRVENWPDFSPIMTR